MTGGILLAVAGAWVLCQVLGGNALGRLGISGEPTTPGTGGAKTAPATAKGPTGSRPLMPAPIN